MATTTTTSQIDPALLPYLTTGLERAQQLFLTGQQPEFFPGQTFVSPSAQTTEALAQQEAIARQASPVLQQAQQAFLGGLTAQSAAAPLYQNIFGAAGMQPGADIYQQAAMGGMPVTGQAQLANLYGQAGQVGTPSIYGQVAGGGFTNPAQAQFQSLLSQAGMQPGADVYQQAAMGGMPVAGQAQLQNLYGAAGAQPGQQVFGAAAGGQLQNIATGQLANIAGGGFLQGNPYQAAMMQAATRPLVQQFGESVLPGISSLYSKSGRLGSGSMERALERSTEAFGRALGDVTTGLAGTQFQQERALQQQALGQLAGVSQQDIATRLAGASALEQAQRAAVGQQAGIAGQLAGLSAQDIQTRLAGASALEQAQRGATAQQAGIAGQLAGLSQQDLANRLAAAGQMEASGRAGIAQQAGLAGQMAGLSQQEIANRLLGAQGLQQAQQAALGTQLQAAGGLGTVQQQDLARQLAAASAAPQIYGQQFLPAQALAEVGTRQEAIAAQPLQEQLARFTFGQQLPYQQLQGYLSSVYGTPLGGYGTTTQNAPTYQNRGAGILGGALAGGLGGYALGQAFPQTIGAGLGGLGGAAIGGLLGGFF